MAVAERAIERLDVGDRVPERTQDVGRPEPEARFQADLDRRREVLLGLDEPAWRADRGRDVHPAVDERRHDLGVDLRLGVATHRPGHDPRPPVPEQHPGEERMERPLARGELIGVTLAEGEERASIVVVDARLGIDHARAEAHVVRLDEAHGVPLAVSTTAR